MCSLMMLDDTGKWLDVRASHGAGPAYRTKPRLSVPESFVGIAVRRQKACSWRTSRVRADTRTPTSRGRRVWSPAGGSACFRHGKATGTPQPYTGEPPPFSDEGNPGPSAYAELSAPGLDKARLYDRTVASRSSPRASD